MNVWFLNALVEVSSYFDSFTACQKRLCSTISIVECDPSACNGQAMKLNGYVSIENVSTECRKTKPEVITTV